MVRLDILSDPICPWCYIGKANLDRALAEAQIQPFHIEWHPFQLNPDMPAEGMDRRAYLEGKFGGPDGAARAYAPVAEAAKAAGLDLKLDAIARTPSTLNAHRLIHWAGVEGRQTEVVTALFVAYFEESEISATPRFCVIWRRRPDWMPLWSGTFWAPVRILRDVQDRDAEARKMGVTGVPTFVISGRHVVQGAQPPELWRQVIDDIAAQLDAASEA